MSKAQGRRLKRDGPGQDRLFADEAAPVIITAIEPLPSDPNLRRVRVGGKAVVTLRATDIELLRLRIGTPWTARTAQRAATALASLKCHATAMKLLSHRDFSRAELIARLEKSGHSHWVVSKVVDELVHSGWIDDRNRAESIARDTVRTRPASRRLLMQRMAARGIDPELAKDVATAAGTKSDELNDATILARQKMASFASLPTVTARRRIAGLLGRRGFDEDTIAQALERIGVRSEDADSTADLGADT